LALHVILVPVAAMPPVPIAFDRKLRLTSINHKVNSPSRNFILRKHGEPPTKQFKGNINLIPAFLWDRRL
jgi:hypothetical protein